MPPGLPLPEPVASSLCREKEGQGDQGAENTPAASAATKSTGTTTAEEELATCIKGPEDGQPRTNGRTRLKTRRISGVSSREVERKEGKHPGPTPSGKILPCLPPPTCSRSPGVRSGVIGRT